MQFHNLKKNKANRKAKQVGRGGTRGKTSGKGTKGQNARSGRKKRPELRDFIKKLPKLRGRGKNHLKSRFASNLAVDLSVLDLKFNSNEVVNMKTLLEKGIVKTKSGKTPKIKILARGALTKPLTIEGLNVSDGARKFVEMAKGSVKNG